MNTERPTLVIDLDNTILDPRKRKAAAFSSALKKAATVLEDEMLEKAGKTYDFSPMKQLISRGKKFNSILYDKFLSNNFLVIKGEVMDEPVVGSVRILNEVIEKGCDIAYLTGRHYTSKRGGRFIGGLSSGTYKTLKHHGFPMPENEHVTIQFKRDRFQNDLEYKIPYIKKLDKEKGVLAVFEDRPHVIKEIRKINGIQPIGVLITSELKLSDYGCTKKGQKKITEYIGRKSVECIRDFSRIRVGKGCKLLLDGKIISRKNN